MLLERAELQCRAGMEPEFEAVLKGRVSEILLSVPGVNSVKVGRGVENPDKFMLLVHWDSMDAHAGFKTLPVYPEFGTLFAPYSIGGAMEHFNFD
ncbi:MAG: antibiotic biosynthesis monooxygenase [Sphingomonadales bacterium]|nr:antibiotic biosynthesis monooxygenase [Sphingomonadales bacterium]